MGVITENFPDISFIDNETVDDVLGRMINDYQEKYKEMTGREMTLAPANPYRLILYACAMQIYQAMQYADYAGKMSFLKYARGEYLDNLVALKGIKRKPASAAVTILKFSIGKPLQSVVSIPAGTRVTNGNDVYFATDEYAEIKAGEIEVNVSATCTEIGTIGNDYKEDEMNILVNILPYISSVSNTSETYGGAEKEDDDSLRERAFHAPDSYSTAGTAGAYTYFVKSVDTSISDVVVKSKTPGIVEVVFACEGGILPEEVLVQKVTDELMNKEIRPLTDKVVARAPEVNEYDVKLTYYIPSGKKASVSAIQENVNAAVMAYNIWQTEKIGRDINPSYLVQKVMEAGVKRVEVESPKFTRMSMDTIASTGKVFVQYGGLEDD